MGESDDKHCSTFSYKQHYLRIWVKENQIITTTFCWCLIRFDYTSFFRAQYNQLTTPPRGLLASLLLNTLKVSYLFFISTDHCCCCLLFRHAGKLFVFLVGEISFKQEMNMIMIMNKSTLDWDKVSWFRQDARATTAADTAIFFWNYFKIFRKRKNSAFNKLDSDKQSR